MLEKLSSVLKIPVLQLAPKAVVFAVVLYWFGINGGFFAGLLVILTASLFYFSIINSKQLIYSFLILLIFIFIVFSQIQSYFPSQKIIILLASVFFGFIFFLILGIKNLIFINRDLAYQFVNGFLFLPLFLAFFSAAKSDYFLLKYLAVFSAIFFLFKESSIFHFTQRESVGVPVLPKINLFSLSFAFLALQFVWAIGILPIGFLNASALMLIIILTFKDLMTAYLSGGLNRHFVLKTVTMLIIFTVAIFAASKWRP